MEGSFRLFLSDQGAIERRKRLESYLRVEISTALLQF